MEKFKSADELKIKAKEAFEFHETAEKLHVTSDGQCFLEQSKSSANFHAKQSDLKVFTFTRAEIMGEAVTGEGDSEDEPKTGEGGNAGDSALDKLIEAANQAALKTEGNDAGEDSGKQPVDESGAKTDNKAPNKKAAAPKPEKAGKAGK